MLLWAESFDYFGDDETKMLDGLWAELYGLGMSAPTLSAIHVRTGTRALRFDNAISTGTRQRARRVFGGPKTTVGVGMALYPESLPNVNDAVCFLRLSDAANAEQVSSYLQSTGIISAKRGDILLGETTVPAVPARAFSHLETKATIDNASGAVEVRVNEVTVLNLTGQDTQATGLAETSQMTIGKLSDHDVSTDWWVDDLFAWDDQIVGDNDIIDFVGDKKVFTRFPNGDTAQADFSLSAGVTGYPLINGSTPDDSTYISSDTDGEVSDFELEDLPNNTVEIVAVIPVPRMYKTDAGSVLVAADLVSGASATAADAIPLTTQATSWPFVHTKDPDTDAPFTLEGFNAAKLRLSRVAP